MGYLASWLDELIRHELDEVRQLHGNLDHVLDGELREGRDERQMNYVRLDVLFLALAELAQEMVGDVLGSRQEPLLNEKRRISE